MKARELEYRDADGVVLQNGDWLLNPHTDDIAQLDIKRKKLFYYDGSSADLRRAGLGSWWHRVDPKDVEHYQKLSQDREAQQAELKRLVRNLQK
jgi:hypothetical protein